ncbi:MAG: TonB-dependent receptor domain-containing protein, partial [Terriglobia bacterium]
LFFSLTLVGRAQVTTGTISGTVADSTGAVLPGAEVVVLNEDTGIARNVRTDAAGRYLAASLNPGRYRVTASQAGFQREVRSGIVLTVGRQAVVNFQLPLGAITQTVEVTGEAPLVETTKGSLGGLVEGSTITELPLNGRDLAQLITLQTGALHYTGSRFRGGEGGKQLAVSGNRPTTNVFLVDGVAIESFNQKTPTGDSGQFLGVDAVREFKVESNAYSAEFGRGSGAQFNIATKSGTNAFHGTLFEFLRNDNLDAAAWEDNAFGGGKPEFKRNQFGGSLGGPILRDRTFFFGTYEGFREPLGTTQVSRTFSQQIRDNPVQFTGAEILPQVRPYLALWPLPNGEVFPDGTGDFIFAAKRPLREDFFQVRVDHQLSDNHSFFARHTFTDSEKVDPTFFPQFTSGNNARNQYLTISETSILSPTLLNTLRFGLSRTRPNSDLAAEDPSVDASLRFVPRVPQMGGIDATDVDEVGEGVVGEFRTLNSFQWVDDAVWTKGSQTLKFGLNWNRLQFNGWNPGRDAGTYQFRSIRDFFQARVQRFRGTIAEGFNDAFRSFRENIIGLYFQDDWQVRPRLTLNLGLRYEFITVPVENHGRVATIAGDLSVIHRATVNDIRRGNPWFENPSLKNFAPRVGFAWDVFGNGSTAVRGGFGMFYLQFNQSWIRTSGFRMVPFLVELESAAADTPFPDIFSLCGRDDPFNPRNPRCVARPAPDMVPDKFSTPYVMQYNLNVQRQLWGDLVVTLGYAGNRGVRLPAVSDLNAPLADFTTPRIGYSAETLRRNRLPNPNFDRIRMRHPNASSFYNSFQLGVRRSLSQGLQFGASYTFSKSVDDISGSQTAGDTDSGVNVIPYYYDRKLYRSLSIFDVRHLYSLNGTYELPIGPGKALGRTLSGAAQKLLAGWQLGGILTLRTGLPGTVLQSARGNMTRNGITDTFPDLRPGFSNNPIEGTTAGCTDVPAGQKLGTPELYFDPCAFAVPPDGVHGNLGRNTVSMPGSASLDFNLTKNTSLKENLNLQFRFEAYNLTNRVNFYFPTGIGSGTVFRSGAGRITRTDTTARQLQMGLKLIF